MHENEPSLYPNEQVGSKVAEYAHQHSIPLPKSLEDYRNYVKENFELSFMMISPLQSQFHRWASKVIGAKRILEIGCFVGYSALTWSEAVGADGHVTTLEVSPEYAKVAQDAFNKYGVKNVDIVVGDARESLKSLASTITEPYDLVFIDADKDSYPTYLSLLLSLSAPGTKTRLLRPGGLIFADNVLRHGLVAEPNEINPWRDQKFDIWNSDVVKILDQFNNMMVNEPRLEAFLMPMFDGLGMSRLKD